MKYKHITDDFIDKAKQQTRLDYLLQVVEDDFDIVVAGFYQFHLSSILKDDTTFESTIDNFKKDTGKEILSIDWSSPIEKLISKATGYEIDNQLETFLIWLFFNQLSTLDEFLEGLYTGVEDVDSLACKS